MTYTNDTSSTGLVHATHVLNYVESTPEVLNALTRYGYDAQQISVGRQLLDRMTRSLTDLTALELRQKALTEQFYTDWKMLKLQQQVHLQTARRCLSDVIPHLLGRLTQRYPSWAADTNRFYTTLLSNPDYLARMNTMGISSADLAQMPQAIAKLMLIKDQQNQNRAAIGVAQQQKETNQQEFKRWFGVLLATARIALRTQPAMLQVLRPVTRNKSNTPKMSSTLPPVLPVTQATPLLAAYP